MDTPNTVQPYSGKLRLATFASFVLMLLIMLFVNKDFGITGDEVTQHNYGIKVYNYFATGGADKGCLVDEKHDVIYYYGGFYDALCVAAGKISPLDVYDTRHLINAVFGFLIIVTAAYLAKLFKGWGAALLTSWFVFLSPRFFGESMNNPKDIPFALGMILGTYFILRMLRRFPAIRLKDALWLGLSIGLAISIRIGGLLLIPYMVVAIGLAWFFQWRKDNMVKSADVKKLFLYSLAASFVGYIVGLLFWPYALQDPVNNPFKALSKMSEFDAAGIRMLFEDKHIMSSAVPWYYEPKYILITTPIIIITGLLLSPLSLFGITRSQRWQLLFLFFTLIFPLFYIAYKKSPVYDGWRHVLFVYPSFAALAALGFITLSERLRHKVAIPAIAGLVTVGLAFPAFWSIKNHPNEIVYFNAFTGGVNGAFGYYETDYYMNSMKAATYKLAKMRDLYNTKDTVTIATNCVEPLYSYAPRISPRIKVEYVRYGQRYDKDWDYGIFYSRFIDKGMLQNGAWPPGRTIATIKADTVTLMAIIQRSKTRNDLKGAQALAAKDFQAAANYYAQAIAEDPRNETAYDSYAIALASSGRIPEAIDAVNKSLQINPNSIQSYSILSQLYNAAGNRQKAQEAAAKGQSLMDEMQE